MLFLSVGREEKLFMDAPSVFAGASISARQHAASRVGPQKSAFDFQRSNSYAARL
jgi:hypothetical protein